MAEDAQTYRSRAAAARGVAAGSRLLNVRNRALRSASRWDELAAHAERAELAAMGRRVRADRPAVVDSTNTDCGAADRVPV